MPTPTPGRIGGHERRTRRRKKRTPARGTGSHDAGDLRRILSRQREGKAEDEQEDDGDENGSGDNVSRRATAQLRWTPDLTRARRAEMDSVHVCLPPVSASDCIRCVFDRVCEKTRVLVLQKYREKCLKCKINVRSMESGGVLVLRLSTPPQSRSFFCGHPTRPGTPSRRFARPVGAQSRGQSPRSRQRAREAIAN